MTLRCPYCEYPLEYTGGIAGSWYSPACGAIFGPLELDPPARARLAMRGRLTIRCPGDGRRELGARPASVLVDEQGELFVTLGCPGCGGSVASRLDERLALRLTGLGIPQLAGRTPAEVIEIVEAPPPTAEEALGVHLLVAPHGWLEQLERELAGRPPHLPR